VFELRLLVAGYAAWALVIAAARRDDAAAARIVLRIPHLEAAWGTLREARDEDHGGSSEQIE
jgi:hypothetical protein